MLALIRSQRLFMFHAYSLILIVISISCVFQYTTDLLKIVAGVLIILLLF